MKSYNPKEIEKRWQRRWEKEKTFSVKEDAKKKKFYALIEFPYPSGAGLHVGHPRPFTAMDVISRKKRMEGYNVLYPIGFDAFGLPTENYAIKTGRPPAKVTKENIATFTRQLKSLGYSFDWSRSVDTTDPEYYRWTQWIFLQLYKHGLAYKKNQPINWCPKDKIGLANEEVVQGCCERCGTPVEQRNKEQWMLAITKYADKLLEGLKEVDYIAPARIQQENWIGRSEGAEVQFVIQSEAKDLPISRSLTVFTTRPDTIFGATFVAVSAELAQSWLKVGWQASEKVKKNVEATLKERVATADRDEQEKTGVDTGIKAVNPANGEEIPVWVTNYVMGGVGTGAIMAVPAHDERDYEFAKKFGLPIKIVICAAKHVSGLKFDKNGTAHGSIDELNASYSDVYTPEEMLKIIEENGAEELEDGLVCNSAFLNGLKALEAKEKMIQWLEEKGVGKRKVNFKLRDWVFSRQRYWGEPLPLVFCEACAKNKKFESKGEEMNPGWIPDEKLPLKLPKVAKYEPTDTGESPLAAMEKWVNTRCPRCGGKARRETDTMPNWAGSSWYFLRYCDPKNKKEFASMKKLKYWLGSPKPDAKPGEGGVDWYNGGMEHTVLHLLYSRFWNQFLFDIGAVPTHEPYKKRTSHGMILGPDGEKMSKSRGNVINPDEMVEKFGTDAFRMYIMFMGPFDQAVMWDTNGLVGVRRFLDKVWNLQEKISENATFSNIDENHLQTTVKKVSDDIDQMKFNTAIAQLMTLTNHFSKKNIKRVHFETLLLLLSPFAPHFCEELWENLGHNSPISKETWPQYDLNKIKNQSMTIVVQVNGKVREEMGLVPEASEEDVKQAALASEKVQKWLEGKEPKKIIYVKGKLVSIVV
ncbi:MAG: leucine--tRNA ligase [Candidatus Magasanikbacteria bacterium]|nr:leucine--tRNA ligase [Candidatus Magasanikbacteria bacterium]